MSTNEAGNLLPKRATPFEWNFNSVLQLISMAIFVSSLFGMAFIWGGRFEGVQRDIGENHKETVDLNTKLETHMRDAEDTRDQSQGELSGLRTSIDATNATITTLSQTQSERINNLASAFDDRMDGTESAVALLTGRMGGAEARNSEISVTLQVLQTAMNDQNGNIKVIAAWVEEQKRRQELSDRDQTTH